MALPSQHDSEDQLPDTQGVDSQQLESESTLQCGVESEIWGRLYSLEESFNSLDLGNDEYTFGRSPTCNVTYTSASMRQDVLLSLSKIHFKIERSYDHSSKTRIVALQDLSYNGTFVNGEPVGRGNKKILQNHDEVALASPLQKAYLYINSNPSNRDGVDLPSAVTDKYVVSRLLGSGTFGKVHLVFDKIKRTKFAMKTIIKQNVTASLDSNSSKKYNEADVLDTLHHPCIIQIFDEIKTDASVHLILEYMDGGDLLNRVQEVTKFAEPVAKFIFYQLALAVQYLHNQGISHRDLKMDNVLLKSSCEYPLVKLADFGLSRVVGDSLMATFCGTPQYLAPEVLKTGSFRGYTTKVDIWSLGVILYICLCGKQPFTKRDGGAGLSLEQQILRGFYTFPQPDWSNVTPAAVALIKKMMVVNPGRRLDIEGVLKQTWLQDQKTRKKVSELLQSQAKRLSGSFDENLAPNKRLRKDEQAV